MYIVAKRDNVRQYHRAIVYKVIDMNETNGMRIHLVKSIQYVIVWVIFEW